MIVIPAIDIRSSGVVRLVQGDYRLQTLYSLSPVKVAERWDSYGVPLIHVVDLDGAIEGRVKNLAIVQEIVRSVKAKVELGGGIRNEKTVKAVLDAGVEKVIIGTMALDERFMGSVVPKFADRIVVALDALEGVIRTKGWLFKSELKVLDVVKRLEEAGVKTVNYTDISKDGMLEGPNLTSIKELLKATKISIIASGGVATLDDVRALKSLEKDGLAGMIIGKALYEEKIDLGEAIKAAGAKERGSRRC